MMAVTLCFIFVCALAVSVSAVEFMAGGGRFSGWVTRTTPTSASYIGIEYGTYGNVTAENLTCQVLWRNSSGFVTTGNTTSGSYTSKITGTDSKGPIGTYPGGSVTHTATYNRLTNRGVSEF